MFFNRWVLSVALIVALTVRFFYSEVIRHSADAFQGRGVLDDVQVGLSNEDLAKVQGYRLAPLSNNIDQVHVRNVRLVERDETTRTVAFDLVSDVPGNDYPNLQVRLLAADGHVVRSALVPPEGYVHGHVLVQEEVRLRLPLVEGASRAAITPMYGARPAQPA
jgi:hypothetical protein